MFIIALNVFTIANKLLLALLLWFKKDSALATKYLAVLIVLPVFVVFSNLVFYLKWENLYFLIFPSQVLVNLFGPIVYLYSKNLMGEEVPLNRKSFIYLLFSLVPVVSWVYLVSLPSAEQHDIYMRMLSDDPSLLQQLLAINVEVNFILFMGLSLYRLVLYRKRVASFFTNTNSVKLTWLIQFTWVLWLLSVALLMVDIFISKPVDMYLIALPVISNIFYFYMLYQSINHAVIFDKVEYEQLAQKLKPMTQLAEEKYANSSLSAEELKQWAGALEELLSKEKLYVNSELSLADLATAMGLSLHKLSEVINRSYEKSFFELINSYRIEEAKRILESAKAQSLKIESVAYDAGFGSKTTFYKAFKKSTGLTPTEYIRQSA